jgi:hypothetical protein
MAANQKRSKKRSASPSSRKQAVSGIKKFIISATPILALLGVISYINDGFSLFDRVYHPKSDEIEITQNPILIHYSKNENRLIREGITYKIEAKTYKVNYIADSEIEITHFDTDMHIVASSNSLEDYNIQLYLNGGSGGEYEGDAALLYVEAHFNIYLRVTQKVDQAKTGKVFEAGTVTLSIPYYVGSVKKVKEQKIPIQIKVVADGFR